MLKFSIVKNIDIQIFNLELLVSNDINYDGILLIRKICYLDIHHIVI